MSGRRLTPWTPPNGVSAPGVYSIREVRQFIQAGRWPSDFPKSISGLRLWFAAHRLTGLNDGDAITTWPDLSGNGYDVTQATSGFRPLYKTNIFKGQPAVQFDGVDDRLENTSSNPFTSGEARTIFYVGRQATTTSGLYITFKRSTPVWAYQNYDSSGPLIFTDGVNTSSNARSNAVYLMSLTTAATIVTIRLSGTGSQPTLRINSAPVTVTGGSTPAGDSGGTGFSIGWRGDTASPHNGPIAEIIAYSGVLSDAGCLSVEKYLAAKYLDIAA